MKFANVSKTPKHAAGFSECRKTKFTLMGLESIPQLIPGMFSQEPKSSDSNLVTASLCKLFDLIHQKNSQELLPHNESFHAYWAE